MKTRISGKDATHTAIEAQKYGPVRIHAAESQSSSPNNTSEALKCRRLPAADKPQPQRKSPPRVRKPSPNHDQYLAPTPDLEGYRARLREAFGNTMSDEFVDVMLGKVVEALKAKSVRQAR